MIEISLARLGVALGGLALSLTAVTGIASAEPDLGWFVNTTCSYPQVMSALNAQDSAAASRFNGSATAQTYLRRFLAAPPDQRQQMAELVASVPENQQYYGLLQQVFSSCNNY